MGTEKAQLHVPEWVGHTSKELTATIAVCQSQTCALAHNSSSAAWKADLKELYAG